MNTKQQHIISSIIGLNP